MKLDARRTLVVGLAMIIGIMPFVPLVRSLAFPVYLLNTHLHEFCHAVAAYLTGGYVDYIRVESDISGVTMLATRAPVVTASAGYVGASIIGALVVVASRTPRGAKIALYALAACLLFSLTFWVRGSAVGVGIGILWVGLLVAGGTFLRGETLAGVAQVVGLAQCFAAIMGVFELFKVAAAGEEAGDAANMAAYTGIPASIWMLLWAIASMALAWMSLKRAWGVDQPEGSVRREP
ncbi:MAG: M50 family metallopeptidase [Chthonomonas sp.]|nr:M50 family metallopeptidase [Chthonomonas sp.]